ncbi:hypothetical protein TSAR_009538 [Trichomalopsis sarcophagae]|uniref:RRM domain-containing protein n=1 Tax=Trichomalopsis sarcophagae TaxID=543379 RepID=A0A232F371_9HYME|nr:hypothetical protein TSAR_009538 [Trichomalopsis sarcophagae]
MSTRVFVGGLTYRVRERDLEKFFRKYGRIKEVAMKNGFAFVEFDDYRDADDAVYELNGKELLGERVAVEIARGVSGRRGDRGYGRSRSWRDKITVERARGTPRGSDQWRYGDSRGGYGDSRRSADSVNRNTRTTSSYKQSLPRYGPPTRTEYRLTVENLSSRVSWQDLKDYMRQAGEVTYADAHKQRRNEGVVEFATYSDLKNAIEKLDDTELNGRRIRLIEDKRRGRRSRSSSSRSRSRAVAALVAVVAEAAAPSRGHTRNPNQSPNPSLLSTVAHVPSPSQEIAQSQSPSQRASPGPAPGLRTTDLNLGPNPNQRPNLHQRKDHERAVSAQEAIDPDHLLEASIARAAVALHHQ